MKLNYPITCETEDVDGVWMVVTLLEWIGDGKWRAVNEDGREAIVLADKLHKPVM